MASRRRLTHETRALFLALGAGAPGAAVALFFLWTGGRPAWLSWTGTVAVAGCWLALSWRLREHVARPLRTIASLLEALREGDYSIRARAEAGNDALNEAMQQVNAMAATLRAQRLGALEATALLRKVMEEIDVAIFAFDQERKLRLVNPAGERLLGEPSERLIGREAESIGLGAILEGAEQAVRLPFGDPTRRWSIGRSMFREGGLPHQLLVVSDITQPLREEELEAWQRLVRVLGHELNNSLAPIKSIAGSMGTLLDRREQNEDWEQDMRRGLQIISSRSESLSRFLSSYARLAKLPKPVLAPVRIGEMVQRVATLETRMRPHIVPGPEVTIPADADQLEQALINLIANAVEASLETGGEVEAGWTRGNGTVTIWVRDEGHGIANSSNLFVPFFTTKPGGSGIGLVLGRKIAESHGGTLTLENRPDRRGSEARLVLPSGADFT